MGPSPTASFTCMKVVCYLLVVCSQGFEHAQNFPMDKMDAHTIQITARSEDLRLRIRNEQET